MKHDFTPMLQRELTPETSQAISQGIDNLSGYMSAAGTSRKERKWQEKWYGIQRADRMLDWQMQNHYNSPAKQMERLKAAGLNPNLVYGNGATATGGSIDAPSGPSANFPVPPTGNGSAVGNYMMVKMQDAQLQNVYAQNDLIQAQIRNLDANALNRGADTALKSFKHRFNLKTEAVDIDTKEANLHNINTQNAKAINEIALSRNRDYREAALNASTLKEAAARVTEIYARVNNLMPAQISEINARIRKMEKEGEILKYENELNNMGVQKSDNFFWRILAQIMRAAIPN